MILYINSYVKHSSPLWPLPTPKDHNWYKFESTLLENEDLSMHSCVRIRPPPLPSPILAYPPSWNHDLSELVFTLPNASTESVIIIGRMCFRKKIFKDFS